jgi:hypothetical protein
MRWLPLAITYAIGHPPTPPVDSILEPDNSPRA